MRGTLMYDNSLSLSLTRSPLYCNGASHRPNRDHDQISSTIVSDHTQSNYQWSIECATVRKIKIQGSVYYHNRSQQQFHHEIIF